MLPGNTNLLQSLDAAVITRLGGDQGQGHSHREFVSAGCLQ